MTPPPAIAPANAEPTTRPAPRVTQKGWHTDPFGQHNLRFHDGAAWTDHTTHFGPVPCEGCGHQST